MNTILLVEDEAITALSEQRILEEEGYSVIWAGSGEKAIEEVRKNHDLDIILMDIDLGTGMDGTNAAEIILREREVPVIFLSSHTEKEVVEKTEGITNYGYVVKNSGKVVLLTSIKMAFKLFDEKMRVKSHQEEIAVANEEMEAANEELEATNEELRVSNENLEESQREILERDHELLVSKERLSLAMDAAEHGFWDWDLETDEIYFSPRYFTMLGYEPDELPMELLTWERLMHPDEREAVMSKVRQFVMNAESYEIEFRLKSKNGSWKWISGRGKSFFKNEEGKPTRALGVHIDITKNKQIQEELKRSEEQYRSFFENSNSVMLIIDHERGGIIDANPAAERFYGWSRGELTSMNIKHINQLSEDEMVHEVGRFRHEKSDYFKSRHILANGYVRDVEVYSGPVYVQDLELLYLIIHDVTNQERIQSRQELYHRILSILNRNESNKCLIEAILKEIKEFTGFDALGIRLQEGDDFPYYVTSGFDDDFVEAERYLCCYDDGCPELDSNGNVYLECMCGNVLQGRTDKSLPFFTEGGSFWSNNTSKLLAETSEEDRQARTRNRCNGEGYESVALIPIRADDEMVGLLQCNDYRTDRFTPDMIDFFEHMADSIGIALQRIRDHNILREKNRELGCVHRLAEIVEKYDTVQEILTAFIPVVKHSMQWPERTGVRIIYEDKPYVSDGFREAPACLSLPLKSMYEPTGVIEIHVDGEKEDVDSFLKDEYLLIHDVAERLGRVIERITISTDYRELFETLNEAILFADTDGVIRSGNQSAAVLCGYESSHDLIGLPMAEFYFDPETRPAIVKKLENEGGRFQNFEFLLRRRDGSTCTTSCNIKMLRYADGSFRGTLGALRDITDKKENEEKIEHFRRLFESISIINRLIVREDDPVSLIQKTCESMVETHGFYNVWIALFDENFQATAVVEAGLGEDFAPMKALLSEGAVSACVRKTCETARVVVVAEPVSSPLCAGCPLAGRYHGRSALSVALNYNNRIYGIITVSIPPKLALNREVQQLFQEIANDIAFALYWFEAEKEVMLLNRIIMTIPQPMALVSPDYRYMTVNNVYSKMYNFDREEIIGGSIVDFIERDLFEKEIRPHIDRCLSGETVGYEVLVDFEKIGKRWMDMSYFPLQDENGAIKGIISHGVDITERKMIESILMENRKFVIDTIESLQEGVMQIDKDFTIRVSNSSFAEIFSLESRKIEGRHCYEVVHNRKSVCPGCRVHDYFNEIITVPEGEPLVREERMMPDGIILDRVVYPTRSSKRDNDSVTVVVTDITEHKKIEAEIKSAYEEKRTLLRELQHRAKNSFAMLYNMIALQKTIISDDKTGQVLGDLEARVKSVSDLYTLIYESGSTKNFSLHTYIQMVVESMGTMFSNIEIQSELDAVTAPVKEAATIGLIVTELVTNAAKHAYPGGNKGTVHVSLKKTGAGTLLEVADEGVGLPVDFDISRTQSMGLELVQAMAMQLGGSLDYETGAGIRWRILLNH